MTRRFNPRWGPLLALLVVWLALPMSGCGGCFQSDADRKQADAETEMRRKEEERRKKEKPKPDFDISSVLHVEPADPEKVLSAAKPGHWVSVSRKAIANNFDFVGSLDADVSEFIDGRAVPLTLEQQPYLMLTTRNIVLPKGQEKYLDQTLFLPRSEHNLLIGDTLNTRSGTPVIERMGQPIDRMPAFQYYILILAREPARYKRFAMQDSILGPSLDGTMKYYRVSAPKIGKYVPLPSNPLAWTSTAYVLWDDIDPSLLSLEQKQAMLDWLHWGGQLIASGPETLTLLRGSFLDPYLPATAGKSRTLNAAALAPLAEAMQPSNHSQSIPPLEPVRPWNAVTLIRRPSAHGLPDDKSDLMAEGAVGRGRIVVTAFHLGQRDLTTWAGFDPLVNSCLLRHPARRYVETHESLTRDALPEWADKNLNRFDPRLICGLRYASRDLSNDGTVSPGTQTNSTGDGTDQSDTAGSASAYPVPGAYINVSANPDRLSLDDQEAIGSGVGGWNDFGGISSAARDSLRAAAGITIPKSEFVAWMLFAYLAVLGPLNWAFFRLIGRVEWAWVAAPLIAIVGALVVTKAAHLNIGFARSQSEIDVVELQPGYGRAHLTRYAALYTSLSTSYELQFDDPHALVEPFALGGVSRIRQDNRTVLLHRNGDVQLTDFDLSSNSTAMFHSEQMIDFGGGIACTSESGEMRIYNHSNHALQQAGVVWRGADGEFRAAWIGQLPADSDRPLEFKHVAKDSPALPQFRDPMASKSEDIAADPAEVVKAADAAPGSRFMKVGNPPGENTALDRSIHGILTNPEGYGVGEMRLVGLLAEPLPGMNVSPQASQATRAGVYVVANLGYSTPPPPRADVNLCPPRNSPLELPEDSPDTPTDANQ